MNTITLSVAAFLMFTAAAVLWLNSRRFSNQVFSFVSILLAVWLACVHKAMLAGAAGYTAELEYWLRASGLVTAFLPGSVWLQIEATIAGEKPRWQTMKRATPWVLLALFLCGMALEESFAKSDGQGRIVRGSAYVTYTSTAILAFSICIFQTLRKLPSVSGIRKTELQFIGLSIVAATLLLGLFNTLGNLFEIRALNRASIIIILGAYVIVTGALIFHRVFNARQIFTFLIQRIALAGILCAGIIYLPNVIGVFVPETAAAISSILLSCAAVIRIHHKSEKWLSIDNESILDNARRAVIDLGIKESNTDDRRVAYEAFLKSYFIASGALLFFDKKDSEKKIENALGISRLAYQTLCRSGWVTPESLHRQRSSPESTEIRAFMIKHALAVIVTVPKGSLSPSLIVALGTKTNDTPFTYPEVLRLQNVSELMDNILTRSQLTAQAALQARMEHLAMMSRGLAHDLKNLITPIASYLVHSAPNHIRGTLEAEVYSSAEKSLRIMNDYVREALFFSEQMAPRFESVNLRRVFDEVLIVTSARAQTTSVALTTVIHGVNSLKGDSVLILRMLVNLVMNAIDASPADGVVSLEAMTRATGWIRLQVKDSGRGISPEHIDRIFDPYFTTKEHGETLRGFGLGLTITQKIVNLHCGKISIQSQLGEGSTICIDFPPAPTEATENLHRISTAPAPELPRGL